MVSRQNWGPLSSRRDLALCCVSMAHVGPTPTRVVVGAPQVVLTALHKFKDDLPLVLCFRCSRWFATGIVSLQPMFVSDEWYE